MFIKARISELECFIDVAMDIETVCCLFLVFFCLVNTTASDDSTSQPACENGGMSSGDGGCFCLSPFTGPTCENGPCNPNPCQNNHTCELSGDSYRCNCKGRYTGDLCDEVLDPCYQNPCKNGGLCKLEGDVTAFKCDCIEPYTGAHCEDATTTSSGTLRTTRNTPYRNSSVLTNTNMTTTSAIIRSTTISTEFVTNATQPTDSAEVHETAVIPNNTISTSEESNTITESTDPMSKDEESSSTESASSETTTENLTSSTDQTLSTVTENPSTAVSQSSSIKTSIGFASSEKEVVSTKPTQTGTSSVTATSSSVFESTISISASEETKMITESTDPMSKDEESSSTESASSKTTTENPRNSTDHGYFASTNPPDTSTIVLESNTTAELTNLTSSKKAKDFTKITQPHTTTVKLTNPAEFVSTTTDTNIFRSTSKESSKTTESIASTTTEAESVTTKPTTSEVNLVNSDHPISSEITTEYVDPRTISSTMEESHKTSTESLISTSTDDTVEKIDISAKKSSRKTITYICGGTGGGFGLIIFIAGITYYIKRVKEKQRRYFLRDDSSSIGSADSTSRLA